MEKRIGKDVAEGNIIDFEDNSYSSHSREILNNSKIENVDNRLLDFTR